MRARTLSSIRHRASVIAGALALVCASAIAAGALTASAHEFRLEGVATWRGGAAAAYSIIHDDLCDAGRADLLARAVPALNARGLRAGFAAIAGECVKNGLWAEVKGLVARGHDVFNHSWSHPCMTVDPALAQRCDPAFPRSIDYAQEIDKSAAVLAANGIAPGLFVFPFDACDPAALGRLEERGYLGARCGRRGINAADFVDGFQLRFDVWGPANSMYGAAAACRGAKGERTPVAQESVACRTYVLAQLVDDAIRQRGWAIRELHGFEGEPGAWGAIALDDYLAHLRYIAAKVDAGELWVDGPTPVLKYRFAREHCPAPTVSRNRLVFAATIATDCARYATALSYRVSTADGSDPPSLAVEQAGVTLPARKVGKGNFVVDADPTKGDALLSE